MREAIIAGTRPIETPLPDATLQPDQALAADPPAAEPDAAEPDAAEPDAAEPELLVEDLLVEDVSIDGMCGVY